jgi:hypothetical protein
VSTPVPRLFNIPFELISDPDDNTATWELELFTCRFLLSHHPDIHELYQESHVVITRDSHLMHKCKTLDEATEYLTAQLNLSFERIYNTSIEHVAELISNKLLKEEAQVKP